MPKLPTLTILLWAFTLFNVANGDLRYRWKPKVFLQFDSENWDDRQNLAPPNVSRVYGPTSLDSIPQRQHHMEVSPIQSDGKSDTSHQPILRLGWATQLVPEVENVMIGWPTGLVLHPGGGMQTLLHLLFLLIGLLQVSLASFICVRVVIRRGDTKSEGREKTRVGDSKTAADKTTEGEAREEVATEQWQNAESSAVAWPLTKHIKRVSFGPSVTFFFVPDKKSRRIPPATRVRAVEPAHEGEADTGDCEEEINETQGSGQRGGEAEVKMDCQINEISEPSFAVHPKEGEPDMPDREPDPQEGSAICRLEIVNRMDNMADTETQMCTPRVKTRSSFGVAPNFVSQSTDICSYLRKLNSSPYSKFY